MSASKREAQSSIDETSPKKKKKWTQTFRTEYSRSYPCITSSDKGNTFAFCSTCRVSVSIAHGGKDDIKKHVARIKHKQADVKGTRPVTDFFQMGTDLSTIKAECLFTSFLMKKNIPMSAADGTGELFREMFPDSKIARNYACGRTKSQAIVNEMAADSTKHICDLMRSSAYSIATDGSNDNEYKLYPIVVRVYDPSSGMIEVNLLSIPNLVGSSTGENIACLMASELEKLNVSWKNCVSFSSDNASVMTGKNKGVVSYLRNHQQELILVGCPCHLIHLAAKKATSALPFKADDLLVDIYYYFEMSAKRRQELQEFQMASSGETRKILKHVSTRWLSLEKALNRLLEEWNPLSAYFCKIVKEQREKAASQSLRSALLQSNKTQKTTEARSERKAIDTHKKQASFVDKFVNLQQQKKPSTDPCTSTTNSSTESRPGVIKHYSSKTGKTTDVQVEKLRCSNSSSCRQKSVCNLSRSSSTKCSGGNSDKLKSSSTKSSGGNSDKLKSSSTKSSGDNSDKLKSSSAESNSDSLGKTANKHKSNGQTRECRIAEELTSFENMAYASFLASTLPVFNATNLALQEDEPQIHLVKTKLTSLLRNIMMRFLLPDVISGDLTEVPYEDKSSHKPDKDIMIGNFTEEVVGSLADPAQFFVNVRQFFCDACTYIINKLPLKDDIYIHAQVVDVSLRRKVSFKSVKFFLNKFPFLLEESYKVQEQFLAYQVDDLPPEIDKDNIRIDTKWTILSTRYDVLARVMLAILVIPHSNADCERVFSLVRKTRTEYRSSMSNRTLEAIVIRKLKIMDSNGHEKFSPEFLRKAKHATSAALSKE
ncbi:uncharacterized protein LOC117316076 [Pecten maximus]|uniref:uncharacterized protein LOC117316076 n=1 Tax=Pecten maximus TaxID=6579 RepID=UPI001458C8B1|nr:uncharacterized protein LOC117316076 [Pecten maximus]